MAEEGKAAMVGRFLVMAGAHTALTWPAISEGSSTTLTTLSPWNYLYLSPRLEAAFAGVLHRTRGTVSVWCEALHLECTGSQKR